MKEAFLALCPQELKAFHLFKARILSLYSCSGGTILETWQPYSRMKPKDSGNFKSNIQETKP